MEVLGVGGVIQAKSKTVLGGVCVRQPCPFVSRAWHGQLATRHPG